MVPDTIDLPINDLGACKREIVDNIMNNRHADADRHKINEKKN